MSKIVNMDYSLKFPKSWSLNRISLHPHVPKVGQEKRISGYTVCCVKVSLEGLQPSLWERIFGRNRTWLIKAQWETSEEKEDLDELL